MFGTNVLRGPVRDEGRVLWVQEIFPTIQGEGPLSGTPALFIRLSGCNLACHFCDTDFESSTASYLLSEIVEIVEAAEVNSDLVVLTGGEPMRQNILPLVSNLVARGYRVQIETAGTLWVPGLEVHVENGRLSIVCSPKTPVVTARVEALCSAWKYIVRTRDNRSASDGLPITSTQEEGRRSELFRPARMCAANVWLQPCEEYTGARTPDPVATRRNVDLTVALCLKHGYRLSYQLHKALGLR